MAAGDGLISMKPTSIAYSGTSASINADGGVDFTAVTSLSLNGVFTSDYDNYLIVGDVTATTDAGGFQFRYRSSGTDATASNYTIQVLTANAGTVGGLRSTSQTVGNFALYSIVPFGFHGHIYGPALTEPTATRAVAVSGWNNSVIYEYATTHSLSTSYDGITVGMGGGTFTGTVHVFGYEE